MEINNFFSSCECSYAGDTKEAPSRLPNPNPNNFNITCARDIGRFIIAMVTYPDCTNFEGKKILVYENMSQAQLFQAARLDPHFCDNSSCISPIARFEPTKRGWEMAITFVLGWIEKG